MEEKEKKDVIRVDDVTKDYGKERGDFHVSLSLKEGETLGIVGENGAGKTTLLRQIMGFIRPDSGSIHIYSFDAYKDAARTKSYIGYIPGEINFPEVASGDFFLHDYGSKLGMKKEDFSYADELIQRMQLDIHAYPKRMSKGMKQKTAIVSAIMLKAPILLMDEPTTGLDPLMREEFLKIVEEQKKDGASIIMTSNTIEELERVSDRVCYLSGGKILDVVDVKLVKERPFRDFKVEFETGEAEEEFRAMGFEILRRKEELHQDILRIRKEDTGKLFDALKGKPLKYISEEKYNLADYFHEKLKDEQ